MTHPIDPTHSDRLQRFRDNPLNKDFEKVYHVPRQFGMSGLIAITTLMAILFGLLRSVEAHPFWYVLWIVLLPLTCMMQMRFEKSPREVSIRMGMVICPLLFTIAHFAVGFGARTRGLPIVFTWYNVIDFLVENLISLTILGSMFGYVGGYLVAFCFLLMDKIDRWFKRNSPPDARGIHWVEEVKLKSNSEKLDA